MAEQSAAQSPKRKLTFYRIDLPSDRPQLTFVRIPPSQPHSEEPAKPVLQFHYVEPLKRVKRHRLSAQQLTAKAQARRARNALRGSSVVPVSSSLSSSFGGDEEVRVGCIRMPVLCLFMYCYCVA